MQKRMEVKILGRVLGTASGWDEVDDEILVFYDFESNGKTTLENGNLTVAFQEGLFEYYNDAGEVEYSQDIIAVLSTMTP